MLIVESYTVIHTLMDVWNVHLILSSEEGGGDVEAALIQSVRAEEVEENGSLWMFPAVFIL